VRIRGLAQGNVPGRDCRPPATIGAEVGDADTKRRSIAEKVAINPAYGINTSNPAAPALLEAEHSAKRRDGRADSTLKEEKSFSGDWRDGTCRQSELSQFLWKTLCKFHETTCFSIHRPV